MNRAEKDSRRSYQDTPHPDFRKHVGILADSKAQEPQGWFDVKGRASYIGDFRPWGAPNMNPTEAEIQAEEDMLP